MAHYLSSLTLVASWRQGLDMPLRGEPRLREADLRLLVGPAVAPIAHEYSMSMLLDPPAPTTPGVSPRSAFDGDKEAVAATSTAGGARLLRATGEYVRFAYASDSTDTLSALFEAGRFVEDDATRTGADSVEERLKGGVALQVVDDLLRLFDQHLPPEALSDWCDAAVDGGSIVPHYMRAASDPSFWVRAVRFGEVLPRNAKAKYWTARLVRSFDTTWARLAGPQRPRLTESFSSRLFGVIRLAFGDALDAELETSMRVARDADGPSVRLLEAPDEPPLLVWARACELVTVDHDGLVEPVEAFWRFYPDDRDPVHPPVYTRSVAIGNALLSLCADLDGEARNDALDLLVDAGSDDRFVDSLSALLSRWLWTHSNIVVRMAAAGANRMLSADVESAVKDAARAASWSCSSSPRARHRGSSILMARPDRSSLRLAPTSCCTNAPST